MQQKQPYLPCHHPCCQTLCNHKQSVRSAIIHGAKSYWQSTGHSLLVLEAARVQQNWEHSRVSTDVQPVGAVLQTASTVLLHQVYTSHWNHCVRWVWSRQLEKSHDLTPRTLSSQAAQHMVIPRTILSSGSRPYPPISTAADTIEQFISVQLWPGL